MPWELEPGAMPPLPAPTADELFAELMREVTEGPHTLAFSASLRHNLEQLNMEERRALMSRTRRGAPPLLQAARRGCVEMVRYMVLALGADIEQRGTYDAMSRRVPRAVTALWAAAASGRVDVMQVLLDAGAEVDAPSAAGSTPLRAACHSGHVAATRCLLAYGADVNRPNRRGSTCLMRAVCSADLCELLLSLGAAVNARDEAGVTALHRAARWRQVEAARVLLDHGADPELRCAAGLDALLTAALGGSQRVMELLAERVVYPPDRRADALELLGATLSHDIGVEAVWLRATALRRPWGAPHSPKDGHAWPEGEAALGAREWTHEWEVRDLEEEYHLSYRVRDQALLVRARVLGPAHPEALRRLSALGAEDDAEMHPQRMVELWCAALAARGRYPGPLEPETVRAAVELTLFLQEMRSSFAAVLRVAEQLRALLGQEGVLVGAAAVGDDALRCATHLLLLMEQTASSPQERTQLELHAAALVAQAPRGPGTGDSLLHMAVSRTNEIHSTFFPDPEDEPLPPVFPSLAITRLLLAAGAEVDARNHIGATPLHVACLTSNHSAVLVQTLLDAGAHIDLRTRHGDTPLALLQLVPESALCPLQYQSLQCLAAAAASLPPHPPPLPLPSHILALIAQHRPFGRD